MLSMHPGEFPCLGVWVTSELVGWTVCISGHRGKRDDTVFMLRGSSVKVPVLARPTEQPSRTLADLQATD